MARKKAVKAESKKEKEDKSKKAGKSISEVKKLREADLYKPVCLHFKEKGYTVRSEVKDCDITAVKDDELVIVELKLNFNATLLLQAVQRQRITDLVYVALPHPGRNIYSRNWKNICHLLRRLELGLIIVKLSGAKEAGADAGESGPQSGSDLNRELTVVFEPVPFDRSRSRQRGKKLKGSILKEIEGRYDDFNTGGTNRTKLVTAYRELSIQIACCIERHGPLSAAVMQKHGTGDKTYSVVSKNFYSWFEKQSKGIYGLSELGRKELQDYPELAEVYRNKFARADSIAESSDDGTILESETGVISESSS